MPDRTLKRRGRTIPGGKRRRNPEEASAALRGPGELSHRPDPKTQADIILETSPLGIVMVDAGGRIVRVNDRLEQMFGYPRGELGGQALDKLLPERLRASHAQHRGVFFGDPHVRPMGLGLDLVARRKDGREFPVEISLSYLRSGHGLFALGFISDITPRRT